MKHSELVDSDATTSETQAYLVDSKPAPTTIHVTHTLRDSAKEAASPSDLTFTPFVKQSVAEKLSTPRGRK